MMRMTVTMKGEIMMVKLKTELVFVFHHLQRRVKMRNVKVVIR